MGIRRSKHKQRKAYIYPSALPPSSATLGHRFSEENGCCLNCGMPKGESTTDCPGFRKHLESEFKFYKKLTRQGKADFVDGKWIFNNGKDRPSFFDRLIAACFF